MNFTTRLPVLLIFATLLAAEAQAITVEDAYRAIPHSRTLFDAKSSTLSDAQTKALSKLFELCDRGVVLRVEGLAVLQSSGDIQLVLSRYESLTSSLESLGVPTAIEPAKALVLKALRLHHQYFASVAHEKATGRPVEIAYRQNAVVQQASQHLISAYYLLIQTFPKEPPVNRQSFYDYLCALDFL